MKYDFDFTVTDEPEASKSQRWKGIMKCYPFEEKRLEKWNPPYIVQPKYDGDRCVNVPRENDSVLFSSEQRVMESIPHINRQLKQSGLFHWPLDGELYSHELFLEGGHELIYSIVSRTVNLHPRHKEMEFWIFDVKVPNLNQVARQKFLNRLIDLPCSIRIAPYWICNTLSEIKDVYDRIIKLGYEGIIVRNCSNVYEEKRSTMMMKFKPKRKDTYKIVGWKEEITKNGEPKGRIGSLLLSSKEGEQFSVSAGLNDDDRELLWNTRNELAGKNAVVHYQHLTNKQIPKGCFDIEVIN